MIEKYYLLNHFCALQMNKSHSSVKPWLISIILPSGSLIQTVLQPTIQASKSTGPRVISGFEIDFNFSSTLFTLKARCRKPGNVCPSLIGSGQGESESDLNNSN